MRLGFLRMMMVMIVIMMMIIRCRKCFKVTSRLCVITGISTVLYSISGACRTTVLIFISISIILMGMWLWRWRWLANEIMTLWWRRWRCS
uniref:Uncharacterized protein n=1 Tax=Panstrongylus lignarius TaxID=156445 RepID=A0A224Y2C4_9HEMI